jgi:crotonobetainyl-CoA:carnitine CoA-transferase CaiB-like acyl-CoA transferase
MAIKPLHGIRVLDLTNVLAGPFACHQLAHMGADVIKVEARGTGDLARQLGADTELNKANMGVSFLAQNPGKRSVTLNLKHAKGKEVFRRLSRTADVVMENFRPGVMDRLGVGHAELMKENPRLVYCAISGFGQDGPLRDLPAYDQIIQGMSGIMSVTGAPENAPYRVGYPVADTIGGITAAFAVAAALADRQRTEGVFIDVSMLEAAMATMGWAVSNHLIAGRDPTPQGNDNVTASPSGTFRTGDGLLNIAANKQEQFEAVCQVLGHADWAQDARFVDRHSRLQHRDALRELMEQAMGAKTASACGTE